MRNGGKGAKAAALTRPAQLAGGADAAAWVACPRATRMEEIELRFHCLLGGLMHLLS